MNHIKPGQASRRCPHRRGHVQLFATVPPHVKDELAAVAETQGLTLREAIEEAIRAYIIAKRQR